MHSFLSRLETKYGGAEGFLREHVGFSSADVTLVRNILLVEATSATKN